MPLLTSPFDDSVSMKPVRRYGIEIDVCPKTGGVWLDKGELEKILEFMRDELEEEQQQNDQFSGPIQNDNRYQREDDEYKRYKENGYYGSGKYYKKKSKMHRIMDLLDF